MLTEEDRRFDRIHRIIASQAMTGESVGIDHYARMIPLASDQSERMALLEDAWHEGQHLLAVKAIAAERGWKVEDGRDDDYWSRIRSAFEECAERSDLVACRIVQDVVLESFATSVYRLLAPRVDPKLSPVFEAIAREEEAHLDQGLAHARRAYVAEPEATTARLEFANQRVAVVLAEWLRPQNCAPVCGVCRKVGGGCAKPDLEGLELDLLRLRGDFANRYGASLRSIGPPAAAVTRWLSRLLV